MSGLQVSVVIPTYNRARYLPRAIESVLIQKGPQWELLIVDDGSTDNTASVLNRYVSNPNIRLLKQSHQGVSAARNLGVSQSKADIIAFLDSDDEWLKGKLEAQLAFMHENGYQIVQTREIWIRNGVRVNPPKHLCKMADSVFSPSLQRCMITPSSVMMTKRLFNAFGGFDESMIICEDYDLWLRITAKHPVGLVEKDYLKRYGGHEDQLSASEPGLDVYRIRALVKLLEEPTLTSEQAHMAKNILSKKLSVFRQGCEKRKKTKEVIWCDHILSKYL